MKKLTQKEVSLLLQLYFKNKAREEELSEVWHEDHYKRREERLHTSDVEGTV